MAKPNKTKDELTCKLTSTEKELNETKSQLSELRDFTNKHLQSEKTLTRSS